ncbi:MAG: hypothetical protein P8N03_01000, partial [Arenicellales bacterium]|nr:hypothetical protein [Arenicellales bacterium]
TLENLSDPRSFFDVTSNSTLYPNGYLNVYLVEEKGCNMLTVEPGRSNGTYYFDAEGEESAVNFLSWTEVQDSKYKDCEVRINAAKCPGCLGAYYLNLDGTLDSEWYYEVKKFQVE